MAWTSPATAIAGSVLTAAWLNTYLRDNLNWLKNPNRCAAFHSTTQNIDDSTWTAIAFDSETFDVGALHSTVSNTSRFTVPSGGDGGYLLMAQASFAAASGGYRAVRFLKGLGATDIGGGVTESSPGTAAEAMVTTSLLVELVAGDVVEAYAFQSSGGSLAIGNAAAYLKNRMQVIQLY